MTTKTLTDVFREAAEIAKQVPDTMQEAAFHRALDALLGEGSSEVGATRKGRRTVSRRGYVAGSRSVEKPSVKLAEASNTRRPAGRTGPKAAVEQLVELGFFSQAKTISDIKAFLESKKGHKYRTTDLSPALVRLLRQQVLDREKNSDGQYEYKGR